jgi:hypothetical protein
MACRRFGGARMPDEKGPAMNKKELRALNDELIDMLITMRDQIDEKLEELGAVESEDVESEDEDATETDEDGDED